MRRFLRLVLVALCCSLTVASAPPTCPLWRPAGRVTLDEAMAALEVPVGDVVRGWFSDAGAAFPPKNLDLLVLKEERQLEIWAPGARGRPVMVHRLPVLGASGHAGPKLREGDGQVPEGIYRVRVLNPNSRYHLSMGTDYPNALDREAARIERRSNLGGDIFLHGGSASVGCVAVGDEAIEPLFWLVARAGKGRVRVLIAPWDLRAPDAPEPPAAAHALGEQRYRELTHAMAPLVASPGDAPRL
ncbi:MAG: L,D-transpeptidase family protein [Myxococcota bacterium]